jgi:Ca-activated chloride channel family protein
VIPQLTHPWVPLLALLIPPLVWWWLRQRRAALRYPAVGWLAGLPAGRGAWARWGGAVLRGLALLLLVLALAGPRWPDLRTRIPTEGIAIMMVTDVSGSMAEPDFDWQGQPIARLDAVKKAFRLFVEGGDADEGRHFDGRPADLVGLVAFATRPDSPCPLTLSHSVLLHLLDGERPRSVPGESETNISDAIVLGLHRLKSAGTKRKIMVLLSDGEHNVPHPQSDWTPRQAAQVAANLHVPVYAIDAGGSGSGSGDEREGGSTLDTLELRKEGKRTLQEVARITHGQYFQAADTRGLLRVCQEIDRVERSEIRSFQYRRYFEAFPWLALASFALWVTVQGLEMTFWRRLP